MKMLYTTAKIKQEIRNLFSDQTRRRVAIVAFVGNDAEAYLPKPEGLELICWPKAGGTSATTVQKLIKAGAKVRFADNLHMKLYWAEGKGAIITSANLSTSALGSGNLKEIGVRLPASAVDINRVIRQVGAFEVDRNKLAKLERADARLYNATQMFDRKPITFADWYDTDQLRDLKFGYWSIRSRFCKEAIEQTNRDYEVKRPFTSLEVPSKNFYQKGDCYLSFKVKEGKGDSKKIDRKLMLTWANVDFVVKDSSARNAYEAVQVYPNNRYSTLFSINQKFRSAFLKAVNEYGVERLCNIKSSSVPKKLVKMIYIHYTAG